MTTIDPKPPEPPARLITLRPRTALLWLILALVIGACIGLEILTLQQVAEVAADKAVEIVLALLIVHSGGKA